MEILILGKLHLVSINYDNVGRAMPFAPSPSHQHFIGGIQTIPNHGW